MSNSSAQEFAGYFRAAHYLRQAINQNRDDTAFAGRSKGILYIVDTNVAEAYLRGKGKQLAGSASLRSLMTDEAAEISDRLTLKYLLSGGLPGQLGPVRMSPPHWDEILARTTRIAEDVTGALKDLGARDREVPDDKLAELRALQGRPADLIAKAEEIGLGHLIEQVRRVSTLSARLKAAFAGLGGDEARLGALAWCEDWMPAANRTRADDVRQWKALLTSIRTKAEAARLARNERSRSGRDDRGEGGAKPPRNRRRGGGNSENIEHDAKTLAAIQAMYRGNPGSIGANAQVRYLLVTSDTAIVQAVEERTDDLLAEGIPMFVRHTRVFNPLINFSAMHRATPAGEADEGLKQVFHEVENAIAKLFPYEQAMHERWARHWSLVENMKRWSVAAERIALVNANLFTVDGEEQAIGREIAELFSGNDVLLAASERIRDTISSIEQDHARNMSAVAFDHLTRVMQNEQREGSTRRERRAPIKLSGIDILSGVKKHMGDAWRQMHTLDHLLDEIALSKGDKRRIVEIVSKVLRENWEAPQSQLLASSIYMAVNAWESAAGCAQRCCALMRVKDPGSPLLREARYCLALSYRMMLRSDEEIEEAREALNANMAPRKREPLLLMRDSVELSTLMLTACITQAIENANPDQFHKVRQLSHLVEDTEIVGLFDHYASEMDSCIADIVADFLGSQTEPDLVNGIAGQVSVNRLGAELFRHYLGEKISGVAPRLAEVYASCRSVLDDIDYPMPLMGQVYEKVAEFELGAMLDAEEVMHILRSACTTEGLAGGDKREFEFFASRVEAQHGQIAGRRPTQAAA